MAICFIVIHQVTICCGVIYPVTLRCVVIHPVTILYVSIHPMAIYYILFCGLPLAGDKVPCELTTECRVRIVS